MTRDLAAIYPWSPKPGGRARQYRYVSDLENYLLISGPRLTQGAAARRLGVSVRTIQRYRRTLRTIGVLP